ncbi:OmpA family protein [Mycobacterium sp. Y57]|uniref:OmpA family protein n=1 Tax=Mycolicibacterium xanthum TaxID=2796469 RepID=UPI001C849AE6|nr:OmpA family protein [Mycolicibacterium xanthum]MBX7432776.1 OmpA family protein [Mycolicibacterium xanthum]
MRAVRPCGEYGSSQTTKPENRSAARQRSPATLPAGLSDFATVVSLQNLVGNRATAGAVKLPALRLQRALDAGAESIALPETTPLNITGSYEAIDPGAYNRTTLQFNQAGYHLEGWYQNRESLTFAGRQTQSMTQRRITADLVGQEGGKTQFRYHKYDSATGRYVSSGFLTVREGSKGSPLLTMSSGGWSHEFEQVSTAPRPPQEAIDALPDGVREIIAAGVAAPLDREEHENLNHNLEILERRIRDYWTEDSDIVRIAPASHADDCLAKIFAMHAHEQRPLVRRLVMEKLMCDLYTHEGNQKSYWNWLQLLVIGHPEFTRDVQSLLGFRSDGGTDQMRTYRYAINLWGFSGDLLAGAGLMEGTFEIEYLGDGPDAADNTEPVWRRELGMGIVQFSLGASGGFTTNLITPWSTFETPYPWDPQNFNGPFLITGVQASASVGAGGGGSAAMMTVWGDGSLPPLPLPGFGALAEVGMHAGIEAGGTAGWIGGTDDEIRANLTPPPEVRGEAAFTASEAIHFGIDDPLLSAEGIAEVRRISALHLSTLESSNTNMRIDGYASTTGTDEHNMQLSLSRSQNVLQQIKDVVPGFAVPDEQITVTGHGETSARESGEQDQTENVAWRRVDIALNGRIVLSLR